MNIFLQLCILIFVKRLVLWKALYKSPIIIIIFIIISQFKGSHSLVKGANQGCLILQARGVDVSAHVQKSHDHFTLALVAGHHQWGQALVGLVQL